MANEEQLADYWRNQYKQKELELAILKETTDARFSQVVESHQAELQSLAERNHQELSRAQTETDSVRKELLETREKLLNEIESLKNDKKHLQECRSNMEAKIIAKDRDLTRLRSDFFIATLRAQKLNDELQQISRDKVQLQGDVVETQSKADGNLVKIKMELASINGSYLGQLNKMKTKAENKTAEAVHEIKKRNVIIKDLQAVDRIKDNAHRHTVADLQRELFRVQDVLMVVRGELGGARGTINDLKLKRKQDAESFLKLKKAVLNFCSYVATQCEGVSTNVLNVNEFGVQKEQQDKTEETGEEINDGIQEGKRRLDQLSFAIQTWKAESDKQTEILRTKLSHAENLCNSHQQSVELAEKALQSYKEVVCKLRNKYTQYSSCEKRKSARPAPFESRMQLEAVNLKEFAILLDEAEQIVNSLNKPNEN